MQRYIPYTLYIVTILAPFTTLKLIDIQLAEWMLPMVLWCVIKCFTLRGGDNIYRASIANKLLLYYSIFLFLALIISLYQCLSLGLGSVDSFGLLKRPYWISMARVVQIGYGAMIMSLGIEVMHKNPKIAEQMATIYLRTGVLVCLFAIVNLHLSYIGLNIILPGQETEMLVKSGRADGTFIEPGPFGLYVLSLISLSLIMPPVNKISKAVFFGIYLYTIYITGSKSAGLTMVAIIIHYLLITRGEKRSGTLTVASIAVLSLIAYKLGSWYIEAYFRISLEKSSAYGGRHMSMHLLPEMFISHPWLGVGIGNYPLFREKFTRLENLPPFGWDLHGMGLAGVLVELGIPLFVFFIVLILRPVAVITINSELKFGKSILYFQPIAYIMGLQPNFIYAWLYTAIATSLIQNKEHAYRFKQNGLLRS